MKGAQSRIPAAQPLNCTPARRGTSSAICECCDAHSRPVPVDEDGEPDGWLLPRGWSTAPYSAGFRHRDGSTGSTYHCAKCNARLQAGEALRLHSSRLPAGAAAVDGADGSTKASASDPLATVQAASQAQT